MRRHAKHILTAAAGLVMALTVFLVRGGGGTAQEVMQSLSDAFFVSGVLIFGCGLLIVGANGGVFDMLTYGVGSLFNVLRPDVTKRKHRTYYDYTEAKSKHKSPYSHFLIWGGALLLLALLFLALYYIV